MPGGLSWIGRGWTPYRAQVCAAPARAPACRVRRGGKQPSSPSRRGRPRSRRTSDAFVFLGQGVVEVGGEVGYVHLGLLELASVVPVHGLPAGELVEHPDARETAPVAALAVAPKGQVGLSAAGGVVDGEHPRAVALPEAQRVRRIGGIDGGREPVAVPVGEGYGLIKVREGGDADDRAEGLCAVDLILHRNAVYDCRVIIDAGLGVTNEALARVVLGDPAHPARTVDVVMGFEQLEPTQKPLVEALAEHGPVQYVLHRVSNGRLLDGTREPGHKLVVDGLVDDHGAQRGAALSRRAEAREQGAFHGEVEVCVGHYYEGVLASELQAGRLHVPAAEFAYSLPDLGRACKTYLVDELFVEGLLQTFEGRRSFGLHHVEDAVGEVAGRDDGRDADRDAEGEELFVWHLRGDGLAVEPAALTGKEVAGVNYLLHLAERLPVRLADLTGHQPRERLLVVFDDAPDLLYYLRADGGRQ